MITGFFNHEGTKGTKNIATKRHKKHKEIDNHGFHGFFNHEGHEEHEEKFNRGLREFTQIFLPTDADLAVAFSIPVSVKLAASVRWAIRDGPHKNMQAGKRGILH